MFIKGTQKERIRDQLLWYGEKPKEVTAVWQKSNITIIRGGEPIISFHEPILCSFDKLPDQITSNPCDRLILFGKKFTFSEDGSQSFLHTVPRRPNIAMALFKQRKEVFEEKATA